MKITSKNYAFAILLALVCTCKIATAQDVDLFKSLDEQDKKDKQNQTDYTTAIFKTTRMINGQSIENVGAGVLDVKISHRFTPINVGAKGLWGLDGANMRMGADYGITRDLMVGFGRTNGGLLDGFAKYKFLRQSTGKVKMPISASLSGGLFWRTQKDNSLNNYSDRINSSLQLIIARKFNDYVSLQVVPTVVHYNSVEKSTIPNDFYSIGFGGRLRLTKRVNLTAEYYYRLNRPDDFKVGGLNPVNSLSVGFDIETGGHVFQFHFSNSADMNDRSFINETTGKWNVDAVRFGFNIARVFVIHTPKSVKI